LTSGQTDFQVRPAVPDDLDVIKLIADEHKEELGFAPRPALARSIDRGQLLVAENAAGVVGFVDFYHRRDEQTTLYHIAVDLAHRGEGIGRALVDALIDDARRYGKSHVQLKCPEGLPANKFYQDLGFEKLGIDPGNRRALLVWRKDLIG